MIIDTHQHFWALERGDYSFPAPDDAALYRDFLPSDLAPHLADGAVTGTIAVQATESTSETDYLLTLAHQNRFVSGVVGWCDLKAASAPAHMDAFLRRGPLVGLRPMLQRSDDASWLLSDQASQNIDAMIDRGLVLEALVDSRHLGIIDAVAEKFLALNIVIDHMAKPWRHPKRLNEWAAAMIGLGQRPNCSVKISGYPFGDDIPAPLPSYPGLIELMQKWFGPNRMLWGSDWPVQLRTTSYAAALAHARSAVPERHHACVFAGNARRIFRLAAPR